MPSKVTKSVFEQFKRLVIDLLGFPLEADEEPPPKSESLLSGVWEIVLPEANGELLLLDERRSRYVEREQAVLEEDLLTSGHAAKLVGALSLAPSVTLVRFGRPFLQPLYGLASGRLCKVDEDAEFAPPQGKRGGKTFHPRARWALMLWTQILGSRPSHKLHWRISRDKELCDRLTDASAAHRCKGPGAALSLGQARNGR